MIEALILMFLLQVKHYHADFVIQTYAQTVRKGIYRDPVGISHSLDHVAGTLICLLIFSLFVVPVSAVTIGVISLVEGILHYHIDWVKVHYGSKDITKPLFWNQFGMDQLAHQLTYLALVFVVLV